jgi:hypothetical protein
MTKHCQYCSGEMKRPVKVSRAQWELQRFCSKRCANLAGACKGVAKKTEPHVVVSYSLHPALERFIYRGMA